MGSYNLHKREDLWIAYRKYFITRNNIETIEEQLRARDLLWMVSLPLDRFEPQGGIPETVAVLNRLKELRIIQRIDVLHLAERWVSKQNLMRQE